MDAGSGSALRGCRDLCRKPVRSRLRKLAVILLAFASAGLLWSCSPGDSQPNVLLITLDTTRADHFGFSGYEAAHTPNFDAFAAERAVSFSNAISAAPVTFPSHSTILTGTYPVFHGVHDNDGYVLDDEVTTLAEILGAEGFVTGAVLAAFPLDSEVNLDQGFETYDDDYTADWSTTEKQGRGAFSFGFLERKADRVNMAVGRWLKEHWQQRFFLWVHYFDSHQPYNAPPPYDTQFASEPYDGEIAFLDENFGKLLEMLESRDLLDNTIIVIVGDHGEALDDHGEPTHAHFVYDATMRVPLLFAVPGTPVQRGTQVPAQVRTVDIAPTILDLLDLPVLSDMQGESLVPLLEDPDREWSSEALIENYYNKFQFGWAPLRGIRTDRQKFIEAPQPELYDLIADPEELMNRAPDQEQRVAEMSERVERLTRRFSSSDPGRSVAAQVDEETRLKLEALGYLGGGSTSSERAALFPDRNALAKLIDPKDKTLVLRYLNFINEMLRAQRFDEALPVIRDALMLDPDNFRLQIQLARALAALERWEMALAAAQQAQLIRPEDGEGFSTAGEIHIARGEYEQALSPLSRAVELFPQRARSLQQLAAAYLALGRDGEAISHFEAALELDAASWVTLADLAQAYFRVARWQDARDRFQQALELNPYSSVLRYRIGVFYRDVGNPEFGRQMFEEALRISPDHLGANLDLGESLLAAGKPEAAREHLERVVELAPASTWGERASELLADNSTD